MSAKFDITPKRVAVVAGILAIIGALWKLAPAYALTEELVATSITNITGFSTNPTVANQDDDCDTPAGDWATAAATQSTVARYQMANPTGTLTSGADLQTARAYVKKSTSNSGTPTWRFEIWETGAGAAHAISSEINVTSTTGQLVTFTWNASGLADASGVDVEIRAFGTKIGGSPSVRNEVDNDCIDWIADYTESSGSRRTLIMQY